MKLNSKKYPYTLAKDFEALLKWVENNWSNNSDLLKMVESDEPVHHFFDIRYKLWLLHQDLQPQP